MTEQYLKITRKRYDAVVKELTQQYNYKSLEPKQLQKLIDKVIGIRFGFTKVVVTYGIKVKVPWYKKPFHKPDTKEFDLKNWFLFREGIIENLYNKGLIKIDFF